jgi:hypothetical protein
MQEASNYYDDKNSEVSPYYHLKQHRTILYKFLVPEIYCDKINKDKIKTI